MLVGAAIDIGHFARSVWIPNRSWQAQPTGSVNGRRAAVISFACDGCRQELAVVDTLAGQQARCSKCGVVVDVPSIEAHRADAEIPLALAITRESPAFVGVYLTLIALGACLAVYIYGFRFDDLSETQLVNLTPAWVFPLVFGVYGFIARHLIRLVQDGQAETLRDAVYLWTRAFGALGLIPMFPFLMVAKWQHSLATAFLAALVWAILLVLFFAVVFPAL